MKAYRRTDLILIAGLALGAVAWLGAAFAEVRSLRPPAGVTDLVSFAEQMPTPQHLAVIGGPDDPVIVWIGDTALSALPSGPACYVFDRSGKLIDWGWETGEGHPIDQQASQALQADPVLLQDALSLTSR